MQQGFRSNPLQRTACTGLPTFSVHRPDTVDPRPEALLGEKTAASLRLRRGDGVA